MSPNHPIRIFALLFAATANPMTLSSADSNPTAPAEQLLAIDRPLVIAHRGYSAIAPENTLPAFELAIQAGADLIELDYHHSKEGVPIVIHDYDLDRTTDADDRWQTPKIRVDTKTTDALLTLDAGRWFSDRFTGVPLPLLTEALDLIQKKSVTLIERKAGQASTCVRLLHERNLVNRVVVQAFDWEYLRDFHRQEPSQILGALGPPSTVQGRKLSDPEKALNSNWLNAVKQTGARIVVWNRQITPKSVQEAHARGLKVWVYTINDPELASRLLDAKIDGIITDQPPLIWRAMALRNWPAYPSATRTATE